MTRQPPAPDWLDAVAQKYFAKLRADVDPKHYDLLAIYCQCLSDYRDALTAKDEKKKQQNLDKILKFSKELGLTPKSKKADEKKATNALTEFWKQS